MEEDWKNKRRRDNEYISKADRILQEMDLFLAKQIAESGRALDQPPEPKIEPELEVKQPLKTEPEPEVKQPLKTEPGPEVKQPLKTEPGLEVKQSPKTELKPRPQLDQKQGSKEPKPDYTNYVLKRPNMKKRNMEKPVAREPLKRPTVRGTEKPLKRSAVQEKENLVKHGAILQEIKPLAEPDPELEPAHEPFVIKKNEELLERLAARREQDNMAMDILLKQDGKKESEKKKEIDESGYFWASEPDTAEHDEYYKKKKKIPMIGKILLVLLVILLLCAAGAFYYINYILSQAKIVDAEKTDHYIPVEEETFEQDEENGKDPDKEEKVLDPEKVLWKKLKRLAKKESDVINILLVGEERVGEDKTSRGRTDCMMIATISKKEKALKLTSLMRDTYVQIPGYSDNKLNAAYRNGGISLLKQTINVNFGVEVDGYVLVDFNAFEDVIDALGGINIKLSEIEANYLRRSKYISKKKYRNVVAGKQHFNGNQALGYTRIRYVRASNGLTDDWGRNYRQRRVLNAVFKKYKSKSAIELVEMLPDILSLVTTDLSKKDMMRYIGTILTIRAKKLETMSVPVQGGYSSNKINGMSVLVPDLVVNQEELHTFLFGD